MNVRIEEGWKRALSSEFDQPYFQQLTDFVRAQYAAHVCYPPARMIFNAFDSCPFDRVKVVILGQDPYHEAGQAHGLSFSVPDGVRFPPSLLNIFTEIHDETGAEIPVSGNLTRWAQQGVLLLNSLLSVQEHSPLSHQGHGWEQFTDAAVRAVSESREHVVFLLWGSYAQRKGSVVDRSRHLVLQSAHPSPLSAYRGFMGNGHFVAANNYLEAHGLTPIVW
ncbi:MAG: uracil-DNA glycosylase [Paludibacteraceae bacterium]|nr:uracil-DNA glycosylase [Paludibacteraceae bacterium]